MLEPLAVIVCVWLFFKALGLAVRCAWGAAKLAASLLVTIAIPLLIGCVVFAGGLLLLIPLAMIALAFGILKAVV